MYFFNLILFIFLLFHYTKNTIQTLLFKLFDKLIRLELVEDSQTLSSSTNQSVKLKINDIYRLVDLYFVSFWIFAEISEC